MLWCRCVGPKLSRCLWFLFFILLIIKRKCHNGKRCQRCELTKTGRAAYLPVFFLIRVSLKWIFPHFTHHHFLDSKVKLWMWMRGLLGAAWLLFLPWELRTSERVRRTAGRAGAPADRRASWRKLSKLRTVRKKENQRKRDKKVFLWEESRMMFGNPQ